MRAYYVRSGWWRRGLVIARSNLHAVQIASETGIHETGREIMVCEIDEATLGEMTRSLISKGVAGRLLPASILRKEPILIRRGII
jgi:hypothetical protein